MKRTEAKPTLTRVGGRPHISDIDLEAYRRAIAAIPGGWTMDVLDETKLSAVLMPEHGDRFCSTYLLEFEYCLFTLHAHHWDEFTLVGIFGSLQEAMAPIAKASYSAAGNGPMRLN